MKKIADLCCKAGGAGVGYHQAGFEVIGFDIQPQPNYPFEFIQADALEVDLSEFDVIHASPPCQCYSRSTQVWRKNGRTYPDLISAFRNKMIETGNPFVIENVVNSPLINPITLCGEMFGLGVIRHRLFETSIPVWNKPHIAHNPNKKYYQVCGHGESAYWRKKHGGTSIRAWEEAMDIDWMTKEELTQAIPPAYTEYIGKQLLTVMGASPHTPL